ncbi:hypothetical protein [Dietzia kunjamensis]|uniref:hypothetical protein n=1 Tax=Dietzia kunjamensis TaxID=322509 RepID=UPI00336806F8
MAESPKDAVELRNSVQDAVTQWFKRNAYTTEEMLESNDESDPAIEISASGRSFPHILMVGVHVNVSAPRIKLEYDVRAQFRHEFGDPVARPLVAEFVRETGAPMLLGMVRGAIATESAIFEQGKILLPFLIEEQLRALPDEAFVDNE